MTSEESVKIFLSYLILVQAVVRTYEVGDRTRDQRVKIPINYSLYFTFQNILMLGIVLILISTEIVASLSSSLTCTECKFICHSHKQYDSAKHMQLVVPQS